jgi:hypothetical protein
MQAIREEDEAWRFMQVATTEVFQQYARRDYLQAWLYGNYASNFHIGILRSTIIRLLTTRPAYTWIMLPPSTGTVFSLFAYLIRSAST